MRVVSTAGCGINFYLLASEAGARCVFFRSKSSTTAGSLVWSQPTWRQRHVDGDVQYLNIDRTIDDCTVSVRVSRLQPGNVNSSGMLGFS